MVTIKARNVNNAYQAGMQMLKREGIIRGSRAGLVYEMPEPVTTVYSCPQERVLFDPGRDANPFFHVMEAIWMLAGRNDVGWISFFNSGMPQFSDDKKKFHGAYGWRWQFHFGFPQLYEIVSTLKRDPDSRRVVLQMWDPNHDLSTNSADIPCNTNIYFKRDPQGHLRMTVCCRSNDIIWGAYGANAVHMSVLHEVIAGMVGCPMGSYYQISDSYHAYVDLFDKKYPMLDFQNHYLKGMQTTPIVSLGQHWLMEAVHFVNIQCWNDEFDRQWHNPWFGGVALPMRMAWAMWKLHRDYDEAEKWAGCIEADDWRVACLQWLARRKGGVNVSA